MFKKIIITGDFQRKNIGQNRNIESLYHLINYQLKLVTGQKASIVKCEHEDDYISENEWLNSFDINNDSLLFEKIKPNKDTLVIGWEFPPNFMAKCDKEGIKYIDILHYPMRFTPDKVWGIKANFGMDKLKTVYKRKAFDDYCYISANEIRAKNCYKELDGLPANTCLFVGQTHIDRSLVKNGGRLLDLTEFESELSALFFDYNNLLFKTHPMNDQTAERQKYFMSSFMAADITNTDIYELLSNPNIEMVAGISSSVLNEAKYFGKKSTYLDYDYINRLENHLPITQPFTSCAFWSILFS